MTVTPATEVQIADADTIRARFMGSEWDEPSSGQFLAKRFIEGPFSQVAGEIKPVGGVALAMTLALYDYVESMGLPDPLKRNLGAIMNMRMEQIGELLAADTQSAATITEYLGEIDRQTRADIDPGGVGF